MFGADPLCGAIEHFSKQRDLFPFFSHLLGRSTVYSGSHSLTNVRRLLKRDDCGPQRSFHGFAVFLYERRRPVSMPDPAPVFDNSPLALLRERTSAIGTGQSGEAFLDRFACMALFSIAPAPQAAEAIVERSAGISPRGTI